MAGKRDKRSDGRRADELRTVKITPDFVKTADGSCLIEMGGTRVICTASIAQGVPRWREASGLGWVTAEYGMLPASTGQRKRRPGLKPDGRGVEIQRLIGRVLRSVVQFEKLADNTIHLDCDVLEADGSTRTASITGAYVAMGRAVERARKDGRLPGGVITAAVAGVSVGIVNARALLDLCYVEDSAADVDMNIAMTSTGKFVELQAASEAEPFTDEQLGEMLRLGKRGIRKLISLQRKALKKRVKK